METSIHVEHLNFGSFDHLRISYPNRAPRIYARKAEFPGGRQKFSNYLISLIKRNDTLQNRLKEHGYMLLTLDFEVDIDGRVENLKVLQSKHQCLVPALQKLIKKLPDWKPAVSNGMNCIEKKRQPLLILGK